MAPVLEFSTGNREPFPIDRPEIYIGRAASCAVRVDGADEQHARLTLDAGGRVFIQDLDTQRGTLRNGNFVYGVQQLTDGDQIEIGGVSVVFRARGGRVAPRAPVRAGAEDRTRLPTELPLEVRAALAARQQPSAAATPRPQPSTAQPQPPPPVRAAPAGVVVGTPEPEPDNFRTVQMAPADLEALGIDPASLPPIKRAAPTPPAPALAPPLPPRLPSLPPGAKRTMLGMPAPVLPQPAQAASAPPVGFGSTMAMEAPTLPPTTTPPARPGALKIAPQQATMMAAAPVVAAPSVIAAPAPSMKTAPLLKAPSAPPAVATPAVATPAVTAPAVTAPAVAAPYAPPSPSAATPQPPPRDPASPTGSFGAFARALAFMRQIFTLTRQHPALGQPLLWNLVLTTPIMAAFTGLELFIHTRGAFYAVLGVEALLLYFVDYACNAFTASLVHEYATTGTATMATAIPRVRKALPGVITFAAASALLDLAATWARERHDVTSRLVLRILRAVWSTATYVIMPALVIEGVPFGAAFKRSKQLMDHDPTGVGAGVVAMSLTSYLVAALCLPLAYGLLRAGSYVHPAVGALLAMAVVNLYWSVSGWMKIAYSTCFYLWANECERTGAADHSLAPMPLGAALDAA